MKKRMLAILLCLVLAASLLPMAALAEGLTINKVSMEVFAPEEGEYPTFPTVYFGAGKGLCDVGNYLWEDMSAGGELVTSYNPFLAGHSYRLTLTLIAGGENVFGGTYPGMVSVNSTDVPNSDITVSADGKKMTVKYTFPAIADLATSVIGSVSVSVDTPAPGAAPGVPTISTANSSLAGYEWSPAAAAFTAGQTYRLTVTAERTSIYYKFTDHTAVLIGGKSATISAVSNTSITFYYDYYVAEAEKTKLNLVQLSVNAPKADEMPVFLADIGSAAYTIYPDDGGSYIDGVCWTDETEDPNLTDYQRVLKNGGSFLNGHSYRVIVELIAADGYTFTENTKAYLNGVTADVHLQGEILRVSYRFPALPALASIAVTTPPAKTDYTVGESFDPAGMVVTATYTDGSTKTVTGYTMQFSGTLTDEKEIWIAYTEGNITKAAAVSITVKSAVKPLTSINAISLTVTVPVVGAQPNYIASAAGPGYRIYTDQNISPFFYKGAAWFEADKIEDIKEDYPPMKTTDVFQAGKYHVEMLFLIAEDGYGFDQSLTAENAPISVSGASYAAVVDYAQNIVMVMAVFPPKEADTRTPITTVSLGAEAPTAGAHPDFSFEIFSGECISLAGSDDPEVKKIREQYEMYGFHNGVFWGVDGPEDPMAKDAVFEEGKTYVLELIVLAKYGYKFDKDNPPVILINGLETESKIGGNSNILYVGKKYVCGPAKKPEKTLTGIAITAPPAKTAYTAGQAFDPAGMVVTATYSDQTTAAVTGYKVTPEKLSQSDGYVTISYTEGDITRTATQAITVKAPKTLAGIAITSPPYKTEYTAGQAFDPAGMVVTATYTDGTTDTVAGYSVTPKLLALGATSVTVSYSEGDVTKTATQAVTVKKNEKPNPFTDVFETDYYYDAVLWAYYAEPQVTNGMSATEFGPKNTVTRGQAVTFLWRAMGRPEPKSAANPFVDVASNEYYYKAVLWAVEKGITKGTDETHFTPGQTCSTAHIITFLYRTLGVGADGWGEESAAWAKNAGLLAGLNSAVAPGVDCPRCDVVLFLHRAVGK